jgi:hypothetical protein
VEQARLYLLAGHAEEMTMQSEQRASQPAADLARLLTEREEILLKDETLAEFADRLERLAHLTGIAPLTVAELAWHIDWTLKDCGLDWADVDFERLDQMLASPGELAAERIRLLR